MVTVAEQQENGKPGAEIQPASASTPAPPPVDQAELEQFRQFQQFQDYLRFTQTQQGTQPPPPQGAGRLQPTQYTPPTTPPPIPPQGALVPAERHRRPAPRWLTWLARKIIAWLLAFVVLAVAGTWLYNHFFPNDAGKSSAQLAQEGGGTYHTNRILSTSPYEAVREVYDAVAQNLVPQACGRMREDVQQKFAQDLGYADCQVAVNQLNKQVTSKNDYAESMPSYVSDPIPGDTFTISSCKFGIRGGPALGAFTVQKVEKSQWLITAHTNESTPCPAPVPTTR